MWTVHVVWVWKSSLLDSSFAYGNQVQWTRVLLTEIESCRLEFLVWFHHNLAAHGCKSSKLDSISTKGNRLYWTWFSINGHHPSMCHMWVPAGTFFPPYPSHSASSAQLSHPLFTPTYNFPQLSHNNLNNTLSQVMFLQYWEYFLLVNIVVIC